MTHTYGAPPAAWKHWAKTLELGPYLLPVVSHPGAAISSDSKMTTIGKTPSLYNFRRQVVGIKGWTQKHATVREVQHWMDEPDYGICVQTRALRAIDIDIEHPRLAKRVVAHIEKLLPWHEFPVRSRPDSSKVLLPFLFEESLTKRVIPCKHGMIEILGDGQQFVAMGTHTGGQRYEWADGLPDAFPTLDVEDFDTLWEGLCTAFLAEGEEPRIARERRKIENVEELGSGSDDVAEWLVANWEVHDVETDGRLYIRCPFEHEHTTDTGPTATAYFPAGSNGYEQGHFACLHAHCQGREDTEFMDACGYLPAQFPDLTDGGDDELSSQSTELVPGEPGQGDGGERELDRPWPRFSRNKHGGIEATARNLALAIAREDICKRWIAWDAFTDKLVQGHWSEPRETVAWRHFGDDDYVRLRIELESRGFAPMGKELLRDCIHMVAIDNRIDTAIEWLSRLEWDGVERIERFFPDYLSTDDTAYARACGLYAWTAHAGRVMQPGVQADMAIMLQGEQGLRKTSAVKAIAPHSDMYTTLDLTKHDDDMARKIRGKLVGELEELRGMNSREAEAIKAWITKTREAWIPKYREFEDYFDRRLILWGSTNEDEFLADPTGERRSLPIEVKARTDIEAIKRDRDQLWAEGAHRFAEEGIIWEEAEELAKDEHHRYAVTDIWEETVWEWLNTPDIGGNKPVDWADGISLMDVAVSALHLSNVQLDRSKQMRIAKILKKHGGARRQVKRAWKYVFV